MSIHEEKVLLEWGSYNVLSVLKDDDGHRYLSYHLSMVLNTEIGVGLHMTTEVTNEDLIGLLECRIPPRGVLTKNDIIWLSNDDPNIFTYTPLSFIPNDLLPYEGMCFEDPTPWKEYLEDLKKENR